MLPATLKLLSQSVQASINLLWHNSFPTKSWIVLISIELHPCSLYRSLSCIIVCSIDTCQPMYTGPSQVASFSNRNNSQIHIEAVAIFAMVFLEIAWLALYEKFYNHEFLQPLGQGYESHWIIKFKWQMSFAPASPRNSTILQHSRLECYNLVSLPTMSPKAVGDVHQNKASMIACWQTATKSTHFSSFKSIAFSIFYSLPGFKSMSKPTSHYVQGDDITLRHYVKPQPGIVLLRYSHHLHKWCEQVHYPYTSSSSPTLRAWIWIPFTHCLSGGRPWLPEPLRLDKSVFLCTGEIVVHCKQWDQWE